MVDPAQAAKRMRMSVAPGTNGQRAFISESDAREAVARQELSNKERMQLEAALRINVLADLWCDDRLREPFDKEHPWNNECHPFR